MLYARDYVEGDAALIAPQASQRVEARVLGGEYDAFAAAGFSYTIVRDFRLVAAGGVLPMWDGLATLWGLAAPMDGAIARTIKRAVELAIARAAPLRRIEATARADFAPAQRFLEWLGFRSVATLTRYGPDGADYVLFARLEDR